MALAYQNLGDYPTADSLLNIAVETQEATVDPRDPDLAITYRVRGGLRMQQGLYAEAESLLVQSVDILSDEAESRADLVLALDRLADAQTALNKNEEAKANYRRALSTEESLPSMERVQRSSILHGLGILYGEEDDFAPAESLLTESLRLHRERSDVRPLSLARVMSSLSVIHMKQMQLDEAEALLREALSLKRERLEPEHPRLASTINNLAVCLERKKQFDEAEALYRETIEILRANHGDVHPGIASTLSNIASLSMRRGDFEQAEERYREVLAMDRQLLPPGHFYIGNDHMRIGQAMARQDRFAEAEPEILKGWEMIQASLDEGTPALDRARSQVKEFYENWGRPEQAARFDAASDTTSATTGE
jgi:tetratricopeptide (TPR) repeat protein